MVVTIDGPAGAGKSTVARRLAERLGFAYVNSGAIYRAVAWRRRAGRARGERARQHRRRVRAGARTGQRVRVDGRDVTEELYTPAVSERAAKVSQRPAVRQFADGLQRRQAGAGPVVVEGRDAGTVVFPEAECKFYLDASPGRARPAPLRGAAGWRASRRTWRRSGPPSRPATTRTGRGRSRRWRGAPTRRTSTRATMTVDEVVELMAKEVERACSTRS